jgi:hypothetical protein
MLLFVNYPFKIIKYHCLWSGVRYYCPLISPYLFPVNATFPPKTKATSRIVAKKIHQMAGPFLLGVYDYKNEMPAYLADIQ